MNKALETVDAVHTKKHFLTEEKACNKFSAGSCLYIQNLIRDG
jgi:hypothetical protein